MKTRLLQHFLEYSAEKHPSKIVVKHKGSVITFEDLYYKSAALGYALKSGFNLRPGDRVGILLDKSINQVVSLLGALYADLIFVLINSILHRKQIEHIVCDAGVKLVISSQNYLSRQSWLNDAGDIEKVMDEEELNQIIDCHLEKRPDNRSISDDIANIIYTSGSTAMPKGIAITHRNLIDGTKIVSGYLKVTEHDRLLGLLPFDFDYGLNQLTTALYKGCSIVLHKYLMPNALLKTLEDEKITGLAAIPTIWTSVFNEKLSNLTKDYDFSQLKYITNSGGKIPVPIVKKIRETFPNAKLYLMYGLTEAFRSTYLDPTEVDKRPDSIGKAIPNVEVEVINEKGEICKPGEVGELIHRGACIARGYWKNKKATLEVYRKNPLLPKESQYLETVVYSGDLVTKDKEGFLYFVGRIDNMIKISGYRVSPTEVEELLLSFDGICDNIVFGLTDSADEQKIRAVVKLSRDIEVHSIITYCKANAPFYMVPHEIYILKDFPKTASGKIDRPRIINESIEKYGK